MKTYKIFGWLFTLYGLFGIADIIYKIIYDQADAIHNGNISGVGLLIVGVIMIVKSRKQGGTTTK